MSKVGKRLIGAAEEAAEIVRYPYTHHGPTVYGSKLADFFVSEANLREDRPDLFEDDTTEGS